MSDEFTKDDLESLVKMKRAQRLEKAALRHLELSVVPNLLSTAEALVEGGSFGQSPTSRSSGLADTHLGPQSEVHEAHEAHPSFQSGASVSSCDDASSSSSFSLEEEQKEGKVKAAPKPKAKAFGGGGSVLDHWAAQNPKEFPNGDTCLFFSAEECNGKPPVIGWAARPVRCREVGATKHQCLGVYVCPLVSSGGCKFRERPRCPRRGKDKYSSGNKTPDAQKDCPKHNCALKLVSCTCTWKKVKDVDGSWTVQHSGEHLHAVPTLFKPTESSKNFIQKAVEENPDIMPCQLDFGFGPRPPASTIHPAYGNRGTLAFHIGQAKQRARSKFSGLSMGNETKNEDSLFEIIRQINEGGTDSLLPGATDKITVSSSLSDINSPAHISFASPTMLGKVKTAATSFQTDTIEGFVKPVTYQGNIYLTVTSLWDAVMDTQVPLLLTVNLGKSAADYKCHWDVLLSNCRGESKEEFLNEFVGNTSDYSDALKNGFLLSLNHTMKKRFSHEEEVGVGEVAEIYRLCVVHYRRSVER